MGKVLRARHELVSTAIPNHYLHQNKAMADFKGQAALSQAMASDAKASEAKPMEALARQRQASCLGARY